MDSAKAFLEQLWATLCQMSPYLLFGFLVAGLLAFFVSRKWVEAHLGGHGLWPVLKATLFGIPLPLCSCSVIPVSASLHKHGASHGATTAFLIATPQTGVDSIFVTFSLLGPVFAIFRPVAALVSGLFGGLVVDSAHRRANGDEAPNGDCTDACCSSESKGSRFAGALKYGFVGLPKDIGRSLLIGVLIAGAIAAFVPDDAFADIGTGPLAILGMMLVGIPLYVCATASIPVAAMLIVKGVSPGAAFAFLMTGPATNAAGLATVWKIMGPRTALVYLSSVAVSALVGGLCLDWLLPAGAVAKHVQHIHETAPSLLEMTAAVALLLVVAHAYFGDWLRGRKAPCPHCAPPKPDPTPCCHADHKHENASGNESCCHSKKEE
jgi:uncharacterized protein